MRFVLIFLLSSSELYFIDIFIEIVADPPTASTPHRTSGRWLSFNSSIIITIIIFVKEKKKKKAF